MSKHYILKPSKADLKLRRAHALYENVMKELHFLKSTSTEQRKAALQKVIRAVPYKHNPAMTHAKNYILKHLKL